MPRKENVWSQVSRYSGLAFILPASTFVGYLLGWLLDKLFHTHFLYLVGLGLGVVAGFIELFRELEAQTRRDAE